MSGHERRDKLRERSIVRRKMFEHEQKWNDAVVRVKVLAKVIMTARLTGEKGVLPAHAVFHERVATL